MKNKLLVSVFAVGIAVFAFTSCETKSNVMDVCTDMIKETLHKTPRSLAQQEGEALSISEYEFLGGVNDNRLVYRTIAFGNGVNGVKKVDTLSYQYGSWSEKNTVFSLIVTPRTGEPYTLLFKGNAFITPDGRSIGGEGTDNTARVEKWEKSIASFPNNAWEALYEGEFVMDSIFKDSIRTIFIPPMTFITDTIQVFSGQMDTLSADTTCYYRFTFARDAAYSNTGHYYRKSIRSKYDRATADAKILSETIKEYDFNWYFSAVTSDSKFTIVLKSLTPGVAGDTLNISKYKVDDTGKAQEFLLGGVTYEHPVLP